MIAAVGVYVAAPEMPLSILSLLKIRITHANHHGHHLTHLCHIRLHHHHLRHHFLLVGHPKHPRAPNLLTKSSWLHLLSRSEPWLSLLWRLLMNEVPINRRMIHHGTSSPASRPPYSHASTTKRDCWRVRASRYRGSQTRSDRHLGCGAFILAIMRGIR